MNTKPKLGRPEVKNKTRPRSVRLTDERWAKLKTLGSSWLAKTIDKAKPCSPSTQSE